VEEDWAEWPDRNRWAGCCGSLFLSSLFFQKLFLLFIAETFGDKREKGGGVSKGCKTGLK
jgi:hypothetical protein